MFNPPDSLETKLLWTPGTISTEIDMHVMKQSCALLCGLSNHTTLGFGSWQKYALEPRYKQH